MWTRAYTPFVIEFKHPQCGASHQRATRILSSYHFSVWYLEVLGGTWKVNEPWHRGQTASRKTAGCGVVCMLSLSGGYFHSYMLSTCSLPCIGLAPESVRAELVEGGFDEEGTDHQTQHRTVPCVMVYSPRLWRSCRSLVACSRRVCANMLSGILARLDVLTKYIHTLHP